jgi:hypothetical protein
MKFISDRIRKFFSQESRIDARFLVIAVLCVYFWIIVSDYWSGNYSRLWVRLGVPVLESPFRDLAAVFGGFDCMRAGFSSVVTNACDFGYPPIWRSLSGLGLGQSDTLTWAILLIALFYLATFFLIGKLNFREGVFYSLFLCSPSVMLLIERANVDLILYFFLFIALFYIKSGRGIWLRLLGYLLILMTAFLKLFTLFSLVVILRETRKNTLYIGGFLFSLFVAYYLAYWQEMKAIASFFFKGSDWYSYGYKTILYRIKAYQTEPALIHGKKRILFSGIVFLTLLFSVKNIFNWFQGIKKWLNSKDWKTSNNFLSTSEYIDSFRIGSGIYMGNFLLIGQTFDYKLTFLLFAIPQILSWAKGSSVLSLPSSFALLGIIGSVYLGQFYAWGIDGIVDFLLCGYFIYSFCLSLPDWLLKSLHNVWARRNPEVVKPK